ncbi:MAG TPA: heavy-metal-associated domain-containing protein [Cytophagaceae bacterium]|jgi:copper chaperone CopZ|nr:heavy-metal-associated domain-containing protein [Cytophagaceae bacterium]
MKIKKTILFLLVAVVAPFLAFNTMASTPKEETSTFKVFGNCGMCKSRIESALKVKGVSKSSWDVKTKMLTVTYDPAVITLDDIHKKIAAVGHDTEKVKAEDKTYANLMVCCQYERKK